MSSEALDLDIAIQYRFIIAAKLGLLDGFTRNIHEVLDTDRLQARYVPRFNYLKMTLLLIYKNNYNFCHLFYGYKNIIFNFLLSIGPNGNF